MKGSLRRDSILTVMGFSLITSVFLFAFYLPESKQHDQLKQEIKEAEVAVVNVPVRLAEITALQEDVARREKYLAAARKSVPIDPDVHAVVQQMAELARNSELQITRLEPKTPVMSETYQRLPFRLSFAGTFRELATFLKGLESQERLFTVQQFTIKQKDTKNTSTVEADMDFSVYIGHAESSNSTGNDGSSVPKMADTETRRTSLSGVSGAK
jgi:Tfp pilus assembly protein PilO